MVQSSVCSSFIWCDSSPVQRKVWSGCGDHLLLCVLVGARVDPELSLCLAAAPLSAGHTPPPPLIQSSTARLFLFVSLSRCSPSASHPQGTSPEQTLLPPLFKGGSQQNLMMTMGPRGVEGGRGGTSLLPSGLIRVKM